MIEVVILKEQVERAKLKSDEMGRLKNSITEGKGNLSGFLGEIIVSDLMGWEEQNTYDYDLVTNTGDKVDVKTKRTNYEPRDYYDCSVAAFNTKQKCDRYVFVRVKEDLSVAWVLGEKSKKEYFQEARLLKKGQKDGNNGFIVKSDCYNLTISNLDDLV